MAEERDIQDVINTLIAEGYGEGEEGMRRIAETVLTRAEQRGISPAEVVRQNAQYTGYAHPGPAAVQAQHNPQAISAAQAAWALAQGPDDPTGGANHYFNPNIVTPSWARSMTPTGTYQNHAFYTDRPVPPRAIPGPPPASQSTMLAARRANTSPSGGDTGLQAALNQLATRQANAVTPVMRRPALSPMTTPDVNSLYAGIYPQQAATRPAQSASDLSRGQTRMIPAKGSLFQPGAIRQSVQSAGSVQNPALAAALARKVASPQPIPQSQIERSVSRPVVQAPPVAAPAAKPRVTVSTPFTTPQSTIERGAPRTQTIGQPPATRIVKSVSMPSIAPAVDVKPQASLSASDMARGRGTAIPDRLAPTQGLPASYGPGISPQQVSQIGAPISNQVDAQGRRVVVPNTPVPIQSAQAPIPHDRPAVASQLSVSPMVAAQRPAARAPVMRAASQRPLQIQVSGARVMQPAVSEMDRLRAMGLSPQQAYDALNSSKGGIGYSDAASRVNGSSTRGSGGARSLLD